MKKATINIVVIIMIAIIPQGCGKELITKPKALHEISTVQELEELAVFSFAIMSDNKGDSPENSPENARMVKWIAERNDQFVIGLGDHLKKDWDNSFLDMVKDTPWWNQNFYPNIADGENEYYGQGQDDWGAGGQLLADMNFSQNSNVEMRDNGCEYYAKISVKGYTIHLIQLHFSDSPADNKLAFREDSRQYLYTTLQNIDKGSKDIIIAAAHSRTGYWIDDIGNRDLKILLLGKCDLMLSATTHNFGRKVFPDYEPSGAVLLNTGSVNYPNASSYGGYVHVSVLEDPLRLIIQYINTEEEDMKLQYGKYAILKFIGGLISSVNFGQVESEN